MQVRMGRMKGRSKSWRCTVKGLICYKFVGIMMIMIFADDYGNHDKSNTISYKS